MTQLGREPILRGRDARFSTPVVLQSKHTSQIVRVSRAAGPIQACLGLVPSGQRLGHETNRLEREDMKTRLRSIWRALSSLRLGLIAIGLWALVLAVGLVLPPSLGFDVFHSPLIPALGAF